MKPFRLLIGYDGSEYSKKALEDLMAAGMPKNVEAVVLTVADSWLPPGREPKALYSRRVWALVRVDRLQARKIVRDAYARACEAAEALRRRFPAWKVRAESTADSPAWGLVKFAGQWKPHLIVLGCHGRSALGRMMLGSVSQKVLTHAECSVRVVRPTVTRGGPPNLIIGFDGSATARRAIGQVADRVWPPGTRVRLITVVDDKIAVLMASASGPKKSGSGSKSGRAFWLERVLQPAVKELKASGLQVVPLILKGDPAASLIQEARRWKADGIFVSARGLVAIERFLIGSVSARLAANAPCTVEVVR